MRNAIYRKRFKTITYGYIYEIIGLSLCYNKLKEVGDNVRYYTKNQQIFILKNFNFYNYNCNYYIFFPKYLYVGKR